MPSPQEKKHRYKHMNIFPCYRLLLKIVLRTVNFKRMKNDFLWQPGFSILLTNRLPQPQINALTDIIRTIYTLCARQHQIQMLPLRYSCRNRAFSQTYATGNSITE